VIRTNLSTRPFYNERAVQLWLLIGTLIVVLATVLNVTTALRYRQGDSEAGRQADADEARTAQLRQEIVKLRASIDPRQIDAASTAARQANELIDRRTFSWTELLNRLETTLPDEAHIVAVRPKLDKATGFVLTLNIVARDVDDVNQFMENLEETGAFKNPRPTTERFNEQGLFESIVEANYLPDRVRTAPPDQPKSEQTEPDQAKPEPPKAGRQ
jgi:type IV pilus assembly protein PilN